MLRMRNLYIVIFLILFVIIINIILSPESLKLGDEPTTEHFNGVLFIKNHANTFPLSPDMDIDNQITASHYMSPYIGWKRTWRHRFASESPALLNLERPDFKQDAQTYF